jgi:hypothetical protein
MNKINITNITNIIMAQYNKIRVNDVIKIMIDNVDKPLQRDEKLSVKNKIILLFHF